MFNRGETTLFFQLLEFESLYNQHPFFCSLQYLEILIHSFIHLLSRLSLKSKAEVSAQGLCLDNECWRLYEKKVHSLLQEGLGDRAKFLRVTWGNATSTSDIKDVCYFMHGNINDTDIILAYMHSNY